jgi:threonine synthase
LTQFRCPACNQTTPADTTRFRCSCGEPFDVDHGTYPEVSTALFDSRLGRSESPYDSGVWRFKELVYPALPANEVVSRPEGNTPIFRGRQVAEYAGVELPLKHEGMNPTGSFKDRGMTVAVTQAAHVGARAVVCASTGNTSAAVAAYAAIAGIPAVILVPKGKTATGKLSQALAYGARTLIIDGNFDDAMHLVQEAGEQLGLYLLNSLNPFRIQGQKSIMLEMLQQLDWDAPDWVVFPAGNLGNTSAFGLALMEAKALGLIDRIPRLAAVQAAGANPFAVAYDRGFGDLEPIRPETIATAIRIGDPVSYHRAIRSIRGTDGIVTQVDDAAILEAKAVVDAAGIGAEPASCATVAGTKQLVERGVISKNDRVVGILTGHLLKDPDTTISYHEGSADRANPPIEIKPTLDALRRVIDRS